MGILCHLCYNVPQILQEVAGIGGITAAVAAGLGEHTATIAGVGIITSGTCAFVLTFGILGRYKWDVDKKLADVIFKPFVPFWGRKSLDGCCVVRRGWIGDRNYLERRCGARHENSPYCNELLFVRGTFFTQY
ncbi:MAG: hypothetical protein JSS50_00290 [Proteobacteria bacterium]|nr:hypothetical protein [Pseudomonadota bacterium]